jgi:hypothetical protein
VGSGSPVGSGSGSGSRCSRLAPVTNGAGAGTVSEVAWPADMPAVAEREGWEWGEAGEVAAHQCTLQRSVNRNCNPGNPRVSLIIA